MHFIVERSKLIPAVRAASQVTEKKSDNIPILQTLLLETNGDQLMVTGSDLSIEVRHEVPVQCNQEGAAAVNAKAILSIISAAPDGSEISIKCDEQVMEILYGRFKAEINILPPADFPKIPAPDSANRFRCMVTSFSKMLEHTSFATNPNDSRYYITGTHLAVKNSTLFCTATDGHRLAEATTEIPNISEFSNVIVPHKTINFLLFAFKSLNGSDIECEINIADALIEVLVNDISIRSKLIDAAYPDTDRLFDAVNDVHGFNFDTGDAIKAIDRIAGIDADGDKRAAFTLGDEQLLIELKSTSLGSATDIIPCEAINGGEVRIGFNIKYFKDVCSHLADTASIVMDDGLSGALFTPVDQQESEIKFRYLVMPTRI